MPQTSYSIDIPAVSYPGQIADAAEVKDFKTALAVAAAIPYGVLVVTDETNTLGFDNIAGKVPSLTTDISTMGAVIGISVADQARAQNPAFPVAVYPQNSAVSVMRVGRIWVLAETAMLDGSNPFFRFAAGAGGTQLGAARNSADTATAVQMPAGQAVVRGTTTGPGYCVIELNIV